MKKRRTPAFLREPGGEESRGFKRFIEILQNDTLNIVKLNLIFILTALPVVTIPAAIYALDRVARMMVLGEDIYCWGDYWTAFKTGWRRAYGAFFMTALPLAAAGTGAWFYITRAAEMKLLLLPFLVCSTAFLVTLLATPYLYGLLNCGLNMREAAKKALVLGMGRPLRGALAAVFYLGVTAAGILALPISGMYVLFLGFSLPRLVGNFFIRTEIGRFGDAVDTP